MDDKQQFALLGQCRSIKENVLSILEKYDDYKSAYLKVMNKREDYSNYPSETEYTLKTLIENISYEVKGILESHTDVVNKAKQIGITITPKKEKLTPEGICRKMIIDCDTIITTIEHTISPLSIKQKSILDTIQKEINELCKTLDTNFEMNLNKAIKNLNDDDSLGSSLITARILDYMLSQLASNRDIAGNSITEKMKTLADNNIIETDVDIVTTLIIKAQKKVRNALDHTISYSPDTSEAISLLGDCVSVMKIYTKAINYKKQ